MIVLVSLLREYIVCAAAALPSDSQLGYCIVKDWLGSVKGILIMRAALSIAPSLVCCRIEESNGQTF